MKALFALFLSLAWLSTPAELKPARFIDVPLQGLPLETQRRLQECEEDMQAVVAMRLPIHAKQDVSGYLFDGGSSLWIGDGYKIRILKQIFLPKNSEKKMSLIYGPLVTVQAGLISDTEIQVSQVRLIPYDQAPDAAFEERKPN